jgi:glucosamine-6-phosphate deaminase
MLKSEIDKATSFEKRFENIGTVVYENSVIASKSVAKEIANLIREKQSQKMPCILGLATGSSPKSLYAELVRLHKEEGLSIIQFR